MDLFFVIILIGIIIRLSGKLQDKVQEDLATQEQNEKMQERNKKLEIECTALTAKKTRLEETQRTLLNDQSKLFADLSTLEEQQNKEIEQLKKLSEQRTQASHELNYLISQTNQMTENMKEASKKAYQEYCDVLIDAYEEKEEEYNKSLQLLENSYFVAQQKAMKELAEVSADLEKMKATREASIQAALREQEINDDLSFYCIELDEIDQADIITLETIKPRLSKPRVLSMLIWQTFYQKPLKSLSARVLGTDTVMGIYKITNIKTEQSYIGQSVDIAKRWSEHAKCGLGIDTPANNKLYKAMKENGLTSFSWELLEKCSRDQLDEKEKFYIELYHADNYGYNSTKGNSR